MSKKNNQQKPQKPQKPVDPNSVIVCMKHPQGITFDLPRDNSGKQRSITINGNAEDLRGREKGIIPSGGFGMTTIAAADWVQIKSLYGGMRIFKSGLIFASGDANRAEDQIDEQDEIPSGMEPPKPQEVGVDAVNGKES